MTRTVENKSKLEPIMDLAIVSSALWLANKVDRKKNGKAKHLTKNESEVIGGIALFSIGALFLGAVLSPRNPE